MNTLSVDEYLRFDESSPVRHEYIAGQAFEMEGSNRRHGRIVRNLLLLLGERLRGDPCEVLFSEIKVRLRVGQEEAFYYPDLMVAAKRLEGKATYLTQPKLIFEVQAPSTEVIDRREEAVNYRYISSLDEYVAVAQRSCKVTIYRRADRWARQILTGIGNVAEFRSIELPLPLAQIYADVC
ncbi:MAG: Uma2 family endonuclease [Gammaproteobacteria bacterium]